MSTRWRPAAVIGAFALVTATGMPMASADSMLLDGDEVVISAYNEPLDLGEICQEDTESSGSYLETVTVTILRASAVNPANEFTSGALVTVSGPASTTVGDATIAVASDTIQLPPDWLALPNNTTSEDANPVVSVTAGTVLGAASAAIPISATGKNNTPSGDKTFTRNLEVNWTVVECADVDITKSVDADYVVVGDSIPYVYEVENSGTVDLQNVGVVDDECSPVAYSSGNTGDPDVLAAGETWTFTCARTAPLRQASTELTNTATVTAYTLPGVEVTAKDSYTLQSLALRKVVAVYWDYITVIADTAAANVEFTVDVFKDDAKVGEEPLTVNEPINVWLTPGTWAFEEQTPPAGYRVFDGRGSWDVGAVPSEDYLDNTFINGSEFDLAIVKSGPQLARVGEDITYGYTVTNTGPAAVTPLVSDDMCTPVEYVEGDTNGDGRIQATETWKYDCTATSSQADWAGEFPAGALTNTASVIDAEADDLAALYGLFGGDTNMANNSATFQLFPFVLRKDVRLYSDGSDVAFDDPTTEFGVKFSTAGFTASMVVSESEPLYLWLAGGSWTIQETSYPKGYLPKETYYVTGITHVTGQFPTAYYPDWTIVNITWSGCSHGYWKNHTGDWPNGFAPTGLVGTYFPAGSYDSTTLAAAMAFQGGGGVRGAERILLIQAVAALLNEAEYGTAFGPYPSLDALKGEVNAALGSGNRDTMLQLASTLDYWNNGVCR